MLQVVKRTFYFRKLLSKRLKHVIGKTEVWLSMKTSNLNQARQIEARLESALLASDIDLKFGLATEEDVLARLARVGIRPRQPKAERHVVDRDSVFPADLQMKDGGIASDDTLKQLFSEFASEQAMSGKWSIKTQHEYRAAFALFWRYLEEAGHPTITHKLLLGYRNTLMALPPRHENQQQLKGKKLADIAAMKHDKTLSNRQINKQTICISGFWKWLVLHHDYVKDNLAHSLLLPKCGSGKSPDTERSAYTADEMKKIIATLDQQKERLLRTRPERYWIPVISAYSGLRLGECSQLFCDDVLLDSGIWCLDIKATSNDDKRLKTVSSTRRIPLHPAVIDRGFLNYREEMKSAGHTRLFPLLVCHPVNGYGHHVGKAYAAWNRRFITKDPLKTFHSLRHAFANTLKQAGIAGELISELLGHRVESISMSRYGKKYRPTLLLEALNKLPR